MAAKNYLLNFDGYWRDVNKDSLPAQSGIYAVYAATYDGIGKTVSLRRLLYIGESADVRSRVATHERRPDWLRKLSLGEILCYSVVPISPTTDRQRAEAAMINHHKPPCNVEHMNDFPFETTSIRTSGKNALMTVTFTVYAKARWAV
jgi:excinuclease UvrABC nuclease subunit